LPMRRARVAIAPRPLRVGVQRPGERVVVEAALERVLELGAQLLALDGREQLDSRIQVAGHQIRGSYVVARLHAAMERVDARVLEESAHDRDDADRLADAGHPG